MPATPEIPSGFASAHPPAPNEKEVPKEIRASPPTIQAPLFLREVLLAPTDTNAVAAADSDGATCPRTGTPKVTSAVRVRQRL